MDFNLACAITQSPAAIAGVERRRLERELDGWVEAHRQAAQERFALARGEFEADAGALAALACAIAEAGRRVSGALEAVAVSGFSTPSAVRPATARDVAEGFEQALDGELLPSAARVVGARLMLELA
jgi:hypothetical protein